MSFPRVLSCFSTWLSNPSDDTLEFINDTPYADGTTVRIELSVGEAYTYLNCSIIADDGTILSTQECKLTIISCKTECWG